MLLGWWGTSARTRATGPEGAARKAPWRAALPQLSRVQTLNTVGFYSVQVYGRVKKQRFNTLDS